MKVNCAPPCNVTEVVAQKNMHDATRFAVDRPLHTYILCTYVCSIIDIFESAASSTRTRVIIIIFKVGGGKSSNMIFLHLLRAAIVAAFWSMLCVSAWIVWQETYIGGCRGAREIVQSWYAKKFSQQHYLNTRLAGSSTEMQRKHF